MFSKTKSSPNIPRHPDVPNVMRRIFSSLSSLPDLSFCLFTG